MASNGELNVKHCHASEVGQTTRQPHLLAIVQALRFSLFGTNARRNRCQEDLNSCPLENWRRPPGRAHTMWMNTIQLHLKSNNLSLDEAIDVAQNRPLWRLMSAFDAMHS